MPRCRLGPALPSLARHEIRKEAGAMAVAILSEVPEGSFAMYEAVTEKLGGRGVLAPGQLIHVVGPLEGGGLRVFDVWESVEDFRRFNEQELYPAVVEVAGGAISPPRRAYFEVMDLVTADSPGALPLTTESSGALAG